jgi:riboflavin synthase
MTAEGVAGRGVLMRIRSLSGVSGLENLRPLIPCPPTSMVRVMGMRGRGSSLVLVMVGQDSAWSKSRPVPRARAEEVTGDGFRVFLSAETSARTTLADAMPGREVNLERALRLGDRLGGHMVQGHVDAAAPVLFIGREGDDMVLRVALPPVVRDLVIPKGSIAVEGVSLTIAHLDDEAFECRIIPHTWTATNLHTLAPGDTVNLEADMLGKYVARLLGKDRQVSLSPGEGPVDEDFLARAGFE